MTTGKGKNMIRFPLTSVIGPLFCMSVSALCMAQEKTVDVSQIPPKDLGFSFVEPKKEMSGFWVGGKNRTQLIKSLPSLNGQSIASLERRMQPGSTEGEGSEAGFLGKDEDLLIVLARDNDFVLGKLGRTHQDIAKPLLLLGYYAQKHASDHEAEVAYGKLRLRIKATRFKGYQLSPFRDGTKTDTDVTVENLATQKKLTYSLLVPHMIERYGFYEGEGTSYRVDPKSVAELLGWTDQR